MYQAVRIDFAFLNFRFYEPNGEHIVDNLVLVMLAARPDTGKTFIISVAMRFGQTFIVSKWFLGPIVSS